MTSPASPCRLNLFLSPRNRAMGRGRRPMAKSAESAIGRRRPPRNLDFFQCVMQSTERRREIGSGGRRRPCCEGRSAAERGARARDSENYGRFFQWALFCGRGGIGSGGRRRTCCKGRSAAERGARAPEGADRQRNSGGTLEISAAAWGRAGVGSGAGQAAAASEKSSSGNFPPSRLRRFFESFSG